MDLILTRLAIDEGATAGDMEMNGTMLFTLELPWLNNEPNKSCVPVGKYELIPYDSPSHGPTWCLHNPILNIYGTWPVPEGGRSQCELHSANWARQLLGCIALGMDDQPMLDPATGLVEPAVEESRDAVGFLIAQLGALSHGHTLTIIKAEAP
jgi:hypothetical protein